METRRDDGPSESSEPTPRVEIPILDITQTTAKRVEVDEHIVDIRTQIGRQELWIDGVYQRYFVSEKGYTLSSNSYDLPRRSLLEATRAYLESQRLARITGLQRFPTNYLDPFGEVFISPTTCERKNFVELSDSERLRLANAFNELNRLGIITSYVQEHAENARNIHWGPAFLPWHRYFLRRFENELQNVDARVFLPYWDWTRENSNDIFNQEVWSSFFGDRNIRGGVFDPEDWELTRALGTETALPSSTLVIEHLGEADFHSYRQIECGTAGHHFGPHQWVGGDMANMDYAARDPLFYLHHCNVDRLWAM